MSIILDALRKSEAARRRNEAPELFASMPTTTAPERVSSNRPLWVATSMGIVALVLALLLWSRGDNSTDIVAQAPNAAIVAAPAPSPSTTATTTNTPIAQPFSNPRAAPNPSASHPIAPTQANDADAIPTPPSKPTLAPAPLEPPASTNTFRSPQSDTPMALADLEPGTRKELPPLKLSMHVWNETASQRFVILDGQRLREGDVLGEVVIERITRDGATLSWRGTALRLEWR